jgi:hypothetical protein
MFGIFSLFLLLIFNRINAALLKGKVNLDNVRLSLNSKIYYARADRTFEIELKNGESYTLEAFSHRHRFHKIRVEVTSSGQIAAFPILPGVEWDGSHSPLSYPPLDLESFIIYDFEPTPPGVSLLSILTNPMVVTVIIPLFLMYLTPKLLENIDPEELKEAQEVLRKQKK